MTQWVLAQINVGRLAANHDDPQVAGFFAALDEINALADRSPGFIWRLQTEAGNATDVMMTVDPRLILNLSVWRDPEALFEFVYRSAHTPVMAQRRNWFERFEGAYQALWWVPADHYPTAEEGLAKLWHLDRFGPTRLAFTFKARFPKPGRPGQPLDMEPDPWCVGRA
ncbi:MAG: DUF3291 domain-containing protein [Rhodospirillales bacterium]